MSAPSTVPFDLNGDGFHDFRAVQTGRSSIRFERWTVDRDGLGSWEPTWLDPQEVYAWLVAGEDEGATPVDNVLRRWLTEREFPPGEPVVVVDTERSPLGAAPGVAPWFPSLDGAGRPRPAAAFGPFAGLGAADAAPIDRSLSLRLATDLDALRQTSAGQQANWTASAVFRFQDHREFRALPRGGQELLERLVRGIATYPASEGWTAIVNLARLLEDGSLGDDWGAALLWELDEVATERGVDDLLLLTIDEATLRRVLTHGVAAPKYLDPEGSTARTMLDHVAGLGRRASRTRSAGDWLDAVGRSGDAGGRALWWLAEWPAGDVQVVSPHLDPTPVHESAGRPRWRSHLPSGRVNHIRLLSAIARLADHEGEAGGAEAIVLATMLDAAGYWPVELMTSADAPGDAFVVAGRTPGTDPADPSTWGEHWALLHPAGDGAVVATTNDLESVFPWFSPGSGFESLGAFGPKSNPHVRPEPRGRGPATTDWLWWNGDARPRLPATSVRPPSLPAGGVAGAHWLADPTHGWVLLHPDADHELITPSPRDDAFAEGSPPPTTPPPAYDVVVWNDRRWVWTGATWRVAGSPPPIRRAGVGAEVTWLGTPWKFDGAVWAPQPTAAERPSPRHRWDGTTWVKPPAGESLADLLRDRLVVLDPGDESAVAALADAEPLPPLPEPEPEPEPEPADPEPVEDDWGVDDWIDPDDDVDAAAMTAAVPPSASTDDHVLAPTVLLDSAHAATIQGPRPERRDPASRRRGVLVAVVLAVVVAVVAGIALLSNDDDPSVTTASTTTVDEGSTTTTTTTTTTTSSSTTTGALAEPAYRTIPLLDGYEFNAPPVLVEDPAAVQITAGPEGTPSDPHLQYSWLAMGDVTLSDNDVRRLEGVVGDAAPGRYNVIFQLLAGDARSGGRYQAGFWFTTEPGQQSAPDGVHAPENRLRGVLASVSFDETNETLTVFDGTFAPVQGSGVFATVGPRVRTLWIPYGEASFVHLSRFVRFTAEGAQPDFSDPASYALQERPFLLGSDDDNGVRVEGETLAEVGARHDGNTHWFFDSKRVLRFVRTYDRCADDGTVWLFVVEQAFTDLELVVADGTGQSLRRPPSGDMTGPVIEPLDFTACR